jgi:hypothetical protein
MCCSSPTPPLMSRITLAGDPWPRFLLVILFSLLVTPNLLHAQDDLLPVLHFQTVEGLFNTQIRSHVVRDQEGFVWVGTFNGLERFDGYTVKDYRNVRDDPHSLSSNYIPALLVDQSSNVAFWSQIRRSIGGQRSRGISLVV